MAETNAALPPQFTQRQLLVRAAILFLRAALQENLEDDEYRRVKVAICGSLAIEDLLGGGAAAAETMSEICESQDLCILIDLDFAPKRAKTWLKMRLGELFLDGDTGFFLEIPGLSPLQIQLILANMEESTKKLLLTMNDQYPFTCQGLTPLAEVELKAEQESSDTTQAEAEQKLPYTTLEDTLFFHILSYGLHSDPRADRFHAACVRALVPKLQTKSLDVKITADGAEFIALSIAAFLTDHEAKNPHLNQQLNKFLDDTRVDGGQKNAGLQTLRELARSGPTSSRRSL